MAKKQDTSIKHNLIQQATTTMTIVVVAAAFLTFFAIASSKQLLSKLSYQNKVESTRQTALKQLQADITSNNNLITSYKAFVNTPQNILGGDPNSNTGPNSGNNAKIVLDALPSQYDFPALATSIQYLLSQQSVNIQSIGGSSQNNASSGLGASGGASVGNATAVPFSFTIDGNYQSIESTIKSFEASIRPMQFLTMQLSGNQSDITLNATGQTYYQAPKKFTISTEAVN